MVKVPPSIFAVLERPESYPDFAIVFLYERRWIPTRFELPHCRQHHAEVDGEAPVEALTQARNHVVPDRKLAHLKVDHVDETVTDATVIRSSLSLEAKIFQQGSCRFLNCIERVSKG